MRNRGMLLAEFRAIYPDWKIELQPVGVDYGHGQGLEDHIFAAVTDPKGQRHAIVRFIKVKTTVEEAEREAIHKVLEVFFRAIEQGNGGPIPGETVGRPL